MAQLFQDHVNENAYEFDLHVDELGEDHARAAQPVGALVPLKPHQLTLLRRCIDMENNTMTLKDFPSLAGVVNDGDTLQTRVGFLGDRVGAGKSFVMLALMLSNSNMNQEDITIKSYGSNKVIFTVIQEKDIIKTNLLVIPHNLTSQWSGYITRFCPSETKTLVVNKKTLADLLDDKLDIREYDLIMVTSTYYNKFANYFADKHWRFQRAFYDEVDNLNIPLCKTIDARFIWLVTASFGNLLYPRGYTRWEHSLSRYIWCANGIFNSGFVKNMLLDLWNNVPRRLTKCLVVKNSDDYIDKSNVLPDILRNIVRCRTPKSIHILNGIVDRNVIECLNADDVQGAISYVSTSNKGSEENIVDIMIQKYTKIIVNLNVKLSYTEALIFDTDADKQAEIAKIAAKIKENETRVNLIKERIKDSDTCAICYDEISNKTITRCCQNSFCFKCINIWLSKSAICPMCKETMCSHDIYSIVNGSQLVVEEIDETKMNAAFDKIKNLGILLGNKKPGDKFLIFSNYDNSFYSIYGLLEGLGIKYMQLKGNGNTIKCMVEKYKTGDIDVLLVNSKHYGSGLNLENTTDIVMFHKFDTEIEKQVVGRAHRLGRAMPLNIWYFLYENEASV